MFFANLRRGEQRISRTVDCNSYRICAKAIRRRHLKIEQLERRQLLAATILNFPGINSPFNPPDTVGDVGPRHYVQMVNATQYQIWDKAGNVLSGPLTLGNLWPVGNVCRSNAGDPIVVYDHLADRWLLSQFANPNHMCFAVSQTPDPTAGSWWTYTFNTGVFPDYPKIGVWPDGYYVSTYEGANLGVYAFNRTAMVAGGAASYVKTTLPSLGTATVRNTRIIPSDLDGAEPPVGTPNYFVRTVDDQQDPANPVDRIEVYAATPNYGAGTISFPLVDTLAPNAFDTMTCNRNGQGVRDCIPQPNTVDTIDALSNRPMMQLRYRNFGNYQSMVFNQTIDVEPLIQGFNAVNEVAGVRWYELRKPGANWNIHQQGNHLPQPGGLNAENQIQHRWMGSSAMDGAGNIATGYSITNSDPSNPVFAGIRYAARFASDPLGTLGAEKIITNGSNFQGDADAFVEPQRWGDYSTMSVDPVDDSTFWFTTHLAGIGGTGARPSRISSFLVNPQPAIKAGDGDNKIVLRKSAAIPDRAEVLIDGAVSNVYVLDDLAKLTIRGGLGTDTLTVDFVNGNPIPAGGLVFEGQNGVGDQLNILNGDFTQIVKTFTGVSDGTVRLVQSGGLTRTITYSGLEPVALAVASVDDLIFNLPTGPNLGVVVGNDLANIANLSEIRGSTFESTSFTNPTNSLRVNLGDLGDSITIQTLDSAFSTTVTTTVNGGDGNDTITGNALSNTLLGGGGNDTLTGGNGDDRLTGGPGNDEYRFDCDFALGADILNESGGGVDTLNFSPTSTRGVTVDLANSANQVVNAALSLTLGSSLMFENVVGSGQSDVISGNSLPNSLNGGPGDDVLKGAGANDVLTGGADSDLYLFDTDLALGSDILSETGPGIDTLSFEATSTRTVTISLGNAAPQVINAGLTLTLGAGNVFENVIGGALGDVLNGNALANNIDGKAGNDSINGGDGDDQLIGGTGDDRYRFDTDLANGTDVVRELVVGGGEDTLNFSTTTTRAINVSLSTAAVQAVNAGLNLSFVAPGAIENVVGGSLGDTIVGNALDNELVGNPGSDVLTGAGGNDKLAGGLGDDAYMFDTDLALGSDELLEEIGGGIDLLSFGATTTRSLELSLASIAVQTINAGLSLKLNAGLTFENVVGGNLADNILGNALANFIDGRGGDDALTGDQGNDTLIGGSGNDTFRFDADVALGADTLNEAGGGADTVSFAGTTTRVINFDLSNGAAQLASLGTTLTLGVGTHFENLVGGSLGDNLTGNGNANLIFGGDGDDTLNGGAGNDILNGGSGIDLMNGGGNDDTLIGGANDDTYRFDTDLALGTDTISESAGGIDSLNFNSTTTRAISVNLGLATVQVVNAGLSLILGATNTIENVIGGSLGDTLVGNGLPNTFTGGPGNDSITGGVGDDTYVFDSDLGLGVDTLNEVGGGFDTLDFSLTATRAVNVNLTQSAVQVVNAGLSLVLGSGLAFEKVIGGGLNDSIRGNTLNNILLGGMGDDTIIGGAGRDLLIAGIGADNLQGESGDDLLIAGSTSHDSNPAALRTVFSEWTSTTNNYNTRVTNLRAGVAGIRLQASGAGATVFDDGAGLDSMTGGTQQDWYFASVTDLITDLAIGELVDTLP